MAEKPYDGSGLGWIAIALLLGLIAIGEGITCAAKDNCIPADSLFIGDYR